MSSGMFGKSRAQGGEEVEIDSIEASLESVESKMIKSLQNIEVTADLIALTNSHAEEHVSELLYSFGNYDGWRLLSQQQHKNTARPNISLYYK